MPEKDKEPKHLQPNEKPSLALTILHRITDLIDPLDLRRMKRQLNPRLGLRKLREHRRRLNAMRLDLPDSTFFNLHVHSNVRGDDGVLTPEQIVRQAAAHRLPWVTITPHDSWREAYERAQEEAARKKLSIGIIPGSEITTDDGHVIVLGAERTIPSGRSLAYTLDAIREQRGLSIIPHIDSPLVASVTAEQLLTLDQANKSADAVEAAVAWDPLGILSKTRGRVSHISHRIRSKLVGGGDSHARTILDGGTLIKEGVHPIEAIQKGLAVPAFTGIWGERTTFETVVFIARAIKEFPGLPKYRKGGIREVGLDLLTTIMENHYRNK